MDNLEKFLKENRSGLDKMESTPMNKMWDNISENLDYNQSAKQETKIRQLRHWVMGLAASLALLLAFGLGYFMNADVGNTVPKEMMVYEAPMTKVSPELKEEEEEFKRLISEKEAEIGMQNLNKEVYKELFSELELLEQIHLETQQDIPEFSDNELLVETLTRYYEQKIRILEQLMREIENQKNREKRINEKPI